MTHLALGPGPEFDRIRAVATALGARAAGLGDDCALWTPGRGTVVLSTDLSIEGIHFRRAWLTPEEIGWRAAAAALSDLAAEGAAAEGVLAAVGVPRDTPRDAVVAVMLGVGDAAAAVGAKVLGGDLSAADRWILAITVFGSAERAVERRGAAPGDRLWVTGELGGARAALRAWEAGAMPTPEARERFARPRPRIAAGRWLAAHGATAMVDLSDGLAADAAHLAAASEVAVMVALDQIPVAPAVVREAEREGEMPAAFAASGGEDYELLVTLPASFGAGEQQAFEGATGLPLTPVGEVARGAGVRFVTGGRELTLRGYDHFR